MVTLENEKLLLRRWQEADAADLYEYAKDEDVGIHAGWPAHQDIEESRTIIETMFIPNPNCFAIVLKANNKVIGSIALDTDYLRKMENVRMMGYALSKDHWGKGYMKEAVDLVLAYAFEDLQLDVVSITHSSQNLRSRSVIEKAGFHFEGILRRGLRRFDGVVLDQYLYSLTQEEYKAMSVSTNP